MPHTPPPLRVRDLMVREVATVERNDPLTRRDLFRGALASSLGYGGHAQDRLFAMLRVKEVMTPTVVTVSPDAPVSRAAALLLEHKIGCLPVVEAGNLLGLVTETSFVELAVAPAGPA